MSKENPAFPYFQFFGKAPIALLVALLLAVVLLGGNIDRVSRDSVAAEATAEQRAGGDTVVTVRAAAVRSRCEAAMGSCGEAAKPMAMILLVIGAGGAFKQVLVDSGIADYITTLTHGWHISPLLLAWSVAAIIRIALGSASVAVVTAAGIVLPLVQASSTPPELMVLAVTCGSIAFSHVNDPGFWMFKEYLNLSVIEAIKVRTTYTTCLSLLGLCGVLGMNLIVG